MSENVDQNAHYMGQVPEEEDYYGILDVKTDSTQEQIKDAYRRLAILKHPDKCDDPNAAQEFSNLVRAYEALSNPLSRAWYDMLIGVKPESAEEMRRINRLQKMDADSALLAMEQTVKDVRRRERDVNGLVVLDAMYGDLTGTSNGAKINVTVPVQCQVEDSRLILNGGMSKAWLQGFYDPCDGEHKQLYVKYSFLNHLHECMVDDMDELKAPLQEHLIEEVEVAEVRPVAPFRQRHRERREQELKKSRRRWALFSALAVAFGLAWANRKGYLNDTKTALPILSYIFGPVPASKTTDSDH